MSRELALYTCVDRMEQGTGKGEAWGGSGEKTAALSQEESLELLNLKNNQAITKCFLARLKSCINDRKAKPLYFV